MSICSVSVCRSMHATFKKAEVEPFVRYHNSKSSRRKKISIDAIPIIPNPSFYLLPQLIFLHNLAVCSLPSFLFGRGGVLVVYILYIPLLQPNHVSM